MLFWVNTALSHGFRRKREKNSKFSLLFQVNISLMFQVNKLTLTIFSRKHEWI